MSKAHRVFLSHAHEDRAYAAKLGKALAKEGIRTFDPIQQLKPGADLFESLREELAASDLIVFVVPAREGEGKWALAEIGAAHAMKKPILAIVPEKARQANTSVARALSNWAPVDAAKLSTKDLARTIIASVPSH